MSQNMVNGSTSLRLSEPRVVALCYMLGWVSGGLLLFLERENKTVRFHACQSVIFSGGLTLLILLLNITAFSWISPLVWFVQIVCLLVLVLTSWGGRYIFIPTITDWADKLAVRLSQNQQPPQLPQSPYNS